ncbi:MAG TPA: acyltransferase [Mycobacteriales bacterium]|nr:acyltransferase [Mycobacteriales bacterium]
MSRVRTLGHQPTLDGLRGLAVLLVVFSHASYGAYPGGFLGVDVFFVLSGFLISTLLLEEWGRDASISLRAFYRRRVRRLLPALLILMAGGGVLQWAFADLGASRPYLVGVLGGLFYLNNWVIVWDPHALRTLAPTWSLAVEEQFYLLWPFLLRMLLRRRITPRRLLTVVGGVISVTVLYTVVVAWTDPTANLYESSVPRAGELALGVALAVLWRERWVPPVLRSRPGATVALGLLLGLGFTADINASRWLYTWAGLFLAAGCAGLLLLTCLERLDSLLGRVFRLRFLRYTGRISYGIYLYNLPLVFLLKPQRLGFEGWPGMAVRLVAIYAVAALSWHLVESRILRRGRRAAPRSGPVLPVGSGGPARAAGSDPGPGSRSGVGADAAVEAGVQPVR